MQIEFWNNTNGKIFQPGIYVKHIFGDWRMLDDLTPEEIEIIFNRVVKEDKARVALIMLSNVFPGEKKKILKQFITCNWGLLDNKWDISEKKLQFERVPCPFKISGNCPYKGKGIICIKI